MDKLKISRDQEDFYWLHIDVFEPRRLGAAINLGKRNPELITTIVLDQVIQHQREIKETKMINAKQAQEIATAINEDFQKDFNIVSSAITTACQNGEYSIDVCVHQKNVSRILSHLVKLKYGARDCGSVSCESNAIKLQISWYYE